MLLLRAPSIGERDGDIGEAASGGGAGCLVELPAIIEAGVEIAADAVIEPDASTFK
ncbi:MAG: hypothetical protein AMXMBFR74_29410 [Parvibaculum sp.]